MSNSAEEQKKIFVKNLLYYLSVSGMQQKELAERSGLSKSAITEYIKMRSYPTPKAMQKLADALGLLISDLREDKVKRNMVPVLGSVPAGIPIEAVEEILDWEEISEDMARCGEYFALRIKGDSMEPRMKEGDVVIVRRQDQVDNGEIAVVKINGNDATVKKFYRRESGITLVGLNPAFEPLTFTPEEAERLPLRVIGKVVELRAKF